MILTTAKEPEKKPKKRRPINRKHLALFCGERRITGDKALAVLKLIKRSHCHILGKARPATCSGKCTNEKGRYVGHGVCLLYRIVQKEYGCNGCRSQEIVAQINEVFSSCRPFKGRDLRAEWI